MYTVIKKISRARGYTLVEIMMVLGIVGLLSAVLVVNIVRNRLITNENMAIGLITTLRTACIAFYGVQTPGIFPQALEDLALPTSNPPFLDQTLINSIKSQKVYKGYFYVYVRLNNNEGFTISARPGTYGQTGNRSFFMDRLGIVYVTDQDREANPLTDPTL